MRPIFVIKEVSPEHWSLHLASGAGASAGRSLYPSAQLAAAEARSRNADAEIEVQIQAADERIPATIRPTLVALAAAGYGQAARTYHLSRRQLAALGLSHDDITRLIHVPIAAGEWNAAGIEGAQRAIARDRQDIELLRQRQV
ncbi:hypothetical protein [Paraburkholderia sp. J41]|uniref:hypothetical protein n=1 Tax=Paraburkholderia sp. J41 TaxID=2805433 RepID=UPI002AC326D8|nr:hypothetical protein [Paraburkholderia sp. J41]